MNILRSVGHTLYRWWMQFAKVLAFVNTRIILTIVYGLLMAPVALVLRLIGKDHLDRRWNGSGSCWKEREQVEATIERSKRQF